MLKDERLAGLSTQYNVARFVSFSPGTEPQVRHLVLGEVDRFEDITSALHALLQLVKTVNVRTFRDDQSKSTPFVYGVGSPNEAEAIVRDFASQGLYTIVNETIDINDGGVSGVTLGGVTEFSPGATPRVVEDPNGDVARLPTPMARAMLRTVYGFDPQVQADSGQRLEFSVHPLRVGSRASHSLVWEIGQVPDRPLQVHVTWPNAFSRFMGDKAYGLLLAHLSGLPVPQSTVVGRNLAPFTFGRSTGTYETWTRTSPATATPGHFTTVKGWIDPVSLLQREDPNGLVASVIAQEGVDARHSGGAISTLDGPLVEGVAGRGVAFRCAGRVPTRLRRQVSRAFHRPHPRSPKEIGNARHRH